MARAVCAAMAEADSGGLARSQLVARAHGPWSQDALEARIDLFVRMGLLRPYLAKAHQQRYVLHPAGMVGLLIIDRIAERRNHDHSRLLGEIGRLNDLVTDNHPDLDTAGLSPRHRGAALRGGVLLADRADPRRGRRTPGLLGPCPRGVPGGRARGLHRGVRVG